MRINSIKISTVAPPLAKISCSSESSSGIPAFFEGDFNDPAVREQLLNFLMVNNQEASRLAPDIANRALFAAQLAYNHCDEDGKNSILDFVLSASGHENITVREAVLAFIGYNYSFSEEFTGREEAVINILLPLLNDGRRTANGTFVHFLAAKYLFRIGGIDVSFTGQRYTIFTSNGSIVGHTSDGYVIQHASTCLNQTTPLETVEMVVDAAINVLQNQETYTFSARARLALFMGGYAYVLNLPTALYNKIYLALYEASLNDPDESVRMSAQRSIEYLEGISISGDLPCTQ